MTSTSVNCARSSPLTALGGQCFGRKAHSCSSVRTPTARGRSRCLRPVKPRRSLRRPTRSYRTVSSPGGKSERGTRRCSNRCSARFRLQLRVLALCPPCSRTDAGTPERVRSSAARERRDRRGTADHVTATAPAAIHQAKQRAHDEHDGGNDDPYPDRHRCLLSRAEPTTGQPRKPDSQFGQRGS
jgi:hypothetical protein